MKFYYLLFFLFPTLKAVSQDQEQLNAKATVFYSKAMQVIKPAYKQYILQTAAALQNKKINADSLHKAIRKNTLFSKRSNKDIDAVEMTILEAAKTTIYNDIANLEQKMVATRKSKEAQERQDPDTIATKNIDKKALKALADKTKKDKDALTEQSEIDQLQLQQLMEKKQQLESMISNIMKSISNTQSAIISNLKN